MNGPGKDICMSHEIPCSGGVCIYLYNIALNCWFESIDICLRRFSSKFIRRSSLYDSACPSVGRSAGCWSDAGSSTSMLPSKNLFLLYSTPDGKGLKGEGCIKGEPSTWALLLATCLSTCKICSLEESWSGLGYYYFIQNFLYRAKICGTTSPKDLVMRDQYDVR